jgi:cell division septum initiation protein DivIVA
MPELKFNLNRGQKYLTKLKKYISEFPLKNAVYTTTNEKLVNSGVEKMRILLNEMKTEYDNYLNEKFTLQKDLNVLKQSIFTANVNSSLSEILTEIEYCNFQINTLVKTSKEIHNIQLNDDTDISNTIERIRSSYVSNSGYFSEPLVLSTDLEQKIKNLRKQVNELENKRDKLNANTEVCIEVSQKCLEILGY